MIVVGIDPGDAWCGFVALNLEKRFIRIESRTYAREPRPLYRMTDALLPFHPSDRITVVVENYQMRGVGHQRFSQGHTLRLLGALEYVCAKNRWDWHVVPPGPWKREVPNIFGAFVPSYREHWPDNGSAEWDHCLSAWRVLGRYLMRDQFLPMLARLRKKAAAEWDECAPFIHTRIYAGDLVAPAMSRRDVKSDIGRR